MEENEFVKNMGACKFCGQTRMVKTIGDITQSKADEIATNECNCKDAKVFQNRESKIKKAQEWVRLRFEHQPNIQEVFNVAVKAVANHDIEKTSIKEGDWTHNIFLDSDGYLNVKSSKKVEEEVDFS